MHTFILTRFLIPWRRFSWTFSSSLAWNVRIWQLFNSGRGFFFSKEIQGWWWSKSIPNFPALLFSLSEVILHRVFLIPILQRDQTLILLWMSRLLWRCLKQSYLATLDVCLIIIFIKIFCFTCFCFLSQCSWKLSLYADELLALSPNWFYLDILHFEAPPHELSPSLREGMDGNFWISFLQSLTCLNLFWHIILLNSKPDGSDYSHLLFNFIQASNRVRFLEGK